MTHNVPAAMAGEEEDGMAGTEAYIEEGPRIAAAMIRVWRLSGRPDPFAADTTGPRPGWESFGLMVAAALESPEMPNEAMRRAARFVNERREAAAIATLRHSGDGE